MRTHRIIRIPLAALAVVLSAGLVACGSSDNSDGGSSSSASSTASSGQAAAIKRDGANAKTTITVGSKNFTEQKVLGEIYAQALEAAGYNVKRALNLGDEQTALKALKGGADRRLPGVHRDGAAVVLRRPRRRSSRPTRRRPTTRSRRAWRKQGIDGASRRRRSRRPTRSG